MRRLEVFAVILVCLLATVVLGAITPLGESEASGIIEEMKKILPEEPNIPIIFINNLRIAFLMLMPVFGLIIGAYATYNTGLAFSAVGILSGVPSSVLLLATVSLPFFWLEFIAYAASMTEGIYLINSIRHHRIRKELEPLTTVIALSVALLLLGAIVEVFVIGLQSK